MNLNRERLISIFNEYSGPVPLSDFNYTINISLQYNYIYVETPKVACSTIKTTLQKMELNSTDLYRTVFEDIHKRELSPLLRPSQTGDFKRLVNSSIFKFCFSRNPFSRLLSVYLEKICGNTRIKRGILKHLNKNPDNLNQDISFDEFINVVCEQSVRQMNNHWRIQYYQTFQSKIEYDFIGKLEAFPTDLNYALWIINKDYKKYLSDERRHSQSASELLMKHYNNYLIKMVQEKFSKDFEFFGYDEDIDAANNPSQPTAIHFRGD